MEQLSSPHFVIQRTRINHAKTSLYQAEKPGGDAASFKALRADLSASQTARKGCVAAVSQKVESQNSASAISFPAPINKLRDHFLKSTNYLKICTLRGKDKIRAKFITM